MTGRGQYSGPAELLPLEPERYPSNQKQKTRPGLRPMRVAVLNTARNAAQRGSDPFPVGERHRPNPGPGLAGVGILSTLATKI